MSSALAADPAMITLTGTIAEPDGTPFADLPIKIREELSDYGGIAGFETTTDASGSFSLDVYAWGTAAIPVSVTVNSADEIEQNGEECSQTWTVAVTFELALAEAAAEPLAVTATLLGEVCGTTGTPGGDTGNGGSGGASGGTSGGGNSTDGNNSSGGNGTGGTGNHQTGGNSAAGGSHGNTRLTPPPTDVSVIATAASGSDRLGPALTVGFIAGLVIAAALVMPGTRARRRR